MENVDVYLGAAIGIFLGVCLLALSGCPCRTNVASKPAEVSPTPIPTLSYDERIDSLERRVQRLKESVDALRGY